MRNLLFLGGELQETVDKQLNTPLGITIFSVMFVVFSAAVWCLTCVVISMLGGWFALTRRFTKQSEPLGEARKAGPWFYTVRLRSLGNYNSVIRLTAAEDALFPSVFLFFRPGHPPLRIPWNEITVSPARRFFRNWVILTLGSEERIPMRISERMARKLGLFERFPALMSAPSPG